MATRLPGDVKRYLALTEDMSLRKILDLCQLNKEWYQDICDNLTFWQSLVLERTALRPQDIDKLGLDDLKKTVWDHENAYESEEGIDTLEAVGWQIGRNNLEDIKLQPVDDDDTYYEDWPDLLDPEAQAEVTKKIRFDAPLILYIPNNDESYGELELPALISPLEIIGAIANYYNEEAAAAGVPDVSSLFGRPIALEGLSPYKDGYMVRIA